ncbi:MAG: hypothetical protein OYH77_01170 [Pseudomonadota bacterium]|nr:hypothetical protein [Pseudomonadota bacterium]
MSPIKKIAWSQAKTLKLAKSLIDRSILVARKDMPRLRKCFSQAEHVEIIQHFATSLADHKLSLINYEKNLESAILWLNYVADDDLVQVFVERLCQSNSEAAVRELLFVTLSADRIDNSRRLDAFTVAIICKIGTYLHTHKLDNHAQLFARVTSHLLSISDTGNMSVRLLLFSYFAAINADAQNSRYFAKIVRRFGCTVLEHVFGLLLNRRSEAFAFEYLRHTIPAILRGGDYFMHQTMQSVFVHHMYRFPKRFTMFLRIFAQELLANHADNHQLLHSWLVHIANLYPLASEINDRSLAADFWDIFTQLPRDEYFDLVIHRISENPKLTPYYRANLEAIAAAQLVERGGKILPLGIKIARRRGRQPTMAKLRRPLSPLQLILWLGEQHDDRQQIISEAS